MNKFSVVFMPDPRTVALVKEMKLQLAAEAGWFNSKNALAHFTIFEFFAEEGTETPLCSQLERIASEIASFNVCCRSFDWFENGAFYIKPDAESRTRMTLLMQQVIQESTRIKKTVTNTTPHLSIARRLSPEQLLKARNMFTETDLSFPVNFLTLRKFDEHLKQFAIWKQFPLAGRPKEIQTRLF